MAPTRTATVRLPRKAERPSRSSCRAPVRSEAGLSAFLGNRTVAVLVGAMLAGSLVYGVELVVLVLVSTDLLGTGTEGFGWLLAASGAGGVLGSLFAPRLAASSRPRATITVLVLCTGLPLAALSVIRLPSAAYAVLLVEGVAILVETAMQRGVAADVLGRVSGLVFSLSAVATGLGTVLAPVLVELIGLAPTLAVAGVVPVGLAAA